MADVPNIAGEIRRNGLAPPTIGGPAPQERLLPPRAGLEDGAHAAFRVARAGSGWVVHPLTVAARSFAQTHDDLRPSASERDEFLTNHKGINGFVAEARAAGFLTEYRGPLGPIYL
ncbi:hypothetical protein [Mangrovibrevibacter kandeliae]|uniref:hypothetical protein n=1 Tax=Mangrovibrevibacter kandeliae TaxID=2968473 RepID=UPI002117F74E|nr:MULTISPECIES: hypothetical protein [unclassified Aurantimonas]MCQ8784088.1 hypothetical protein [Aurantimonas sp. CSK15Z-1]MCW4116807.1 hypothetical protein [Aurantimonas sp. MSK8Z-1]